MRNTFISIGFTIITLSQLVLGIWMTALAMKNGGESRLTCETNRPQSVRPTCTAAARSLPNVPLSAYDLCVFVQNRDLTVAYTCISLVYGARKLSWAPSLIFLMTSVIRHPCIFVDYFFGSHTEGAGARYDYYYRDYREGCNAILLSDIYFPPRTRDDSEPWTGESDTPLPEQRPMIHDASLRNPSNCSQLCKSSQAQ